MKLLPCPHCGGKGLLVHDYYEGPDDDVVSDFYVECKVCLARTARVRSEDAAMMGWNMREKEELKVVSVMNEGVIRIYSDQEEWMDCVFVVAQEDAEKAKDVLTKAMKSFWDDGEGWYYGNYFEAKLVENDIAYRAYYADEEPH